MESRTNVKWLVVMGLLAAVVLGMPKGAAAVTLGWDANGTNYGMGQWDLNLGYWNAGNLYWNTNPYDWNSTSIVSWGGPSGRTDSVIFGGWVSPALNGNTGTANVWLHAWTGSAWNLMLTPETMTFETPYQTTTGYLLQFWGAYLDTTKITVTAADDWATIAGYSGCGGWWMGRAVTKDGAGTLTIGNAGGSFNGDSGAGFTYAGLTVDAGTVIFNRPDGVSAVGGLVTVNAGGLVKWNRSNQMPNLAGLMINGGTADIQSYNDIVGAVTLMGGGSINGTIGILTGAGYDVRSGTANAILDGSGDLVKSTSDTVTLNANNMYNGATYVLEGTLIVNGSLNTASLVSVAGGAMLGGSGTVGSVSVLGTVAPGNSIDTLDIDGDASFDSGSTLDIEIGSLSVSDLLAITGNLSLETSGAGVTLNVTGTADGSDYTIATFGGSLLGTFTTWSLPDGYDIVYGDHSIQLTPEPASLVMLGLGFAGLLSARRRREGGA